LFVSTVPTFKPTRTDGTVHRNLGGWSRIKLACTDGSTAETERQKNLTASSLSPTRGLPASDIVAQ
jgi:hypothetical protein